MIMYIAAIASAVTLTISPVPTQCDGPANKKIEWQNKSAAPGIRIQGPIEISGPANVYVLSAKEQNIMRMALLRSVKIVDRGRLV